MKSLSLLPTFLNILKTNIILVFKGRQGFHHYIK
ncbi:hypothetical protein FB550_101873 [Neobacillus bataviensis]|uniref:Uncharacterized protein n=1 Tax=Neobacillus bataviensis TaxID=220685 RepID=A0A561DZP4_9BACI|nr:hypothetical protein FB550_101873 [Neobacillus bataviensis]